ncbi:hypothetical protein ID866_10624 [Astraeus odoratus]|nr:hypothetical protein ID866_10624 [Astraeus odoratus]
MSRISLLSYEIPDLHALVDSGSTHCFVDQSFINNYAISTYSVPPIQLRLIDGISNFMITQAADLSVWFPMTGDVTPMTFYLVLLDFECKVVLGYNWLTCYNPLINWMSSAMPARTPLQVPPIAFINATAYVHACKFEGSLQFSLQLCPPSSSSASAHLASTSDVLDLSSVLPEYHEFADVFSKAKALTLPPHRKHDLKINLEEGTTPPLRTIYSLSPVELDALWKFIDKNLSMGFICPTSSSHAAPVLFVKKKDGSLCLCVDYRRLNKLTKKDHYPLPLISDLLDSPSCAKIYTKIDLWHAYHLVQITPGDEWKTVFWTHYGSYKWLVMPFSLTNAPAAFQRFVNTIFTDMLDVCIVISLDNILIYLGNKESHKQHVKEVLQCLCKHGLYTKLEKCEFHLDSVKYLDYHLSPEGLMMFQDKVKTIIDWPEPHKVKDIQSFLGFANFYCRFIYNYSHIVAPLTCLTWKNVPWNFSEDCCSTFCHLKDAFTSAPVLTHYIPGTPLTVETDASDYAIVGILSTICDDDQLHPVTFYSWTLSAPELNYDTHDKELLAIFEAFHTWRHYLKDTSILVDVVMDHKNLKYFSMSKVLTRHQVQWSEYLL